MRIWPSEVSAVSGGFDLMLEAYSSSAYYTTIFTSRQQKERSGFLATLWSKDTYRSHWNLIARVFSIVRDTADAEQDLRLFLSAVCPPLGIVPPAQYLATFNWSLAADHRGKNTITQTRAPPAPAAMTMTSMIDIYKHAIMAGYPLSKKDRERMINRLHEASNGFAMVSTPSKEKDFLKLVKEDPIQATAEVWGCSSDDPSLRYGVNIFHVDDIRHPAQLFGVNDGIISMPQSIPDTSPESTPELIPDFSLDDSLDFTLAMTPESMPPQPINTDIHFGDLLGTFNSSADCIANFYAPLQYTSVSDAQISNIAGFDFTALHLSWNYTSTFLPRKPVGMTMD
jgi:hypothetical protein